MGLALLSQQSDAAKHVFSTCELKMSTQQGEQHCHSNDLIFLHRTKLKKIKTKQKYTQHIKLNDERNGPHPQKMRLNPVARDDNLIIAINLRPV